MQSLLIVIRDRNIILYETVFIQDTLKLPCDRSTVVAATAVLRGSHVLGGPAPLRKKWFGIFC